MNTTAMTDTTPDYAGLSRRLGALAYHIQQTGTADGQDAQTCLEVAEALRALLESNAALEARVKELEARLAEADRDNDHLKLALQAERQKPMRCDAWNGDGQVSRPYGYIPAWNGDGQVSRPYGYIPCYACNGRGF